MNKLFFIGLFFLLINGCSYEPIFLKKKVDFKFNGIDTEGDDKINTIIKNNLLIRANGKEVYDVYISTKKDKDSISLNEKGDTKSFNIKINVDYRILKNENLIFKNKIIKQTTYNNITDKFELSKIEENILKSLSNTISNEIIMSITMLDQ